MQSEDFLDFTRPMESLYAILLSKNRKRFLAVRMDEQPEVVGVRRTWRRMGGWLGFSAGVLLWGMWAWLHMATALAHAYVIRSIPADNQMLGQPPSTVQLTFNEPVQTVFGGLTVVDAKGARVDAGDAHLDAHDPRTLVCTLRPGLAAGPYRVQWRVISDDGDPVSGVIPFRVGQATSAAGVTAAAGATSEYQPGVGMLVIRAVFLAGLLLLLGTMMFWRWVIPASLRGELFRPCSPLAWLGSAGLLLGTWLSLPLQASIDAGVPFLNGLSPSLWETVLTHSRFGLPWMVEGVASLAVLALLKHLQDHPERARNGVFVVLAVGLALSWSRSVQAHAAGVSLSVVSVALDMVHIWAASLWVGGLAALVWVLWRLHRDRGAETDSAVWAVVGRFGWAAGIAVAVLVLSGLWGILQNVPTWASLFQTAYGWTLVTKLLLVAAMLLLAVVHRLVRRRKGTSVRSGRTAWLWVLELILAAAVIVDTARLTNLPTARANPGPIRVVRTLTDGNQVLRAILVITPNRVGQNLYQLQFTDANGRPFTRVKRVTLGFDMLDMRMDADSVSLSAAKPGVYQASGLDLTMAGTWLVHVNVQWGDAKQASMDVRIVVGSLS